MFCVVLCMLQVYHGDISCANILVTFDWVAKIADFGLSRALHGRSRAEAGPGDGPRALPNHNPMYLAKEALEDRWGCFRGAFPSLIELRSLFCPCVCFRVQHCHSREICDLNVLPPAFLPDPPRRVCGPPSDVFSFACVLWAVARVEEPWMFVLAADEGSEPPPPAEQQQLLEAPRGLPTQVKNAVIRNTIQDAVVKRFACALLMISCSHHITSQAGMPWQRIALFLAPAPTCFLRVASLSSHRNSHLPLDDGTFKPTLVTLNSSDGALMREEDTRWWERVQGEFTRLLRDCFRRGSVGMLWPCLWHVLALRCVVSFVSWRRQQREEKDSESVFPCCPQRLLASVAHNTARSPGRGQRWRRSASS